MLDQVAAGAVSGLATPVQCLNAEAGEEAALDPAFVRDRARSIGICSFTTHRPNGIHKGNVMLCYELEFDDPTADAYAVIPRVEAGNDEVGAFMLMPEARVLESILAGKWKPAAAVITIEFLIRHGRITPETDARFAEVCSALRSDLGCLPLPCYA